MKPVRITQSKTFLPSLNNSQSELNNFPKSTKYNESHTSRMTVHNYLKAYKCYRTKHIYIRTCSFHQAILYYCESL